MELQWITMLIFKGMFAELNLNSGKTSSKIWCSSR